MTPSRVQAWLTAHGFGDIATTASLGGGCINNVTRLTLNNGDRLIMKRQERPPDGLFQAEAAGLKALAESGALRVPEVLAAEDDFLLLEDLGQGVPGPHYWSRLGAGLASLHSERRRLFGFTRDSYCGSTIQDNRPLENGHEFYANRRLRPLARACHSAGLLDARDMQRLERVCDHLPDWIPDQPPVLIHGDLWSGNIHCDGQGQPALIDPAAYWGWAEAELAMTTLFGRCPDTFYESYLDNSGVDAHWEERAFIYNLYHLLNHAKLFGGSYVSAVQSTLTRLAP